MPAVTEITPLRPSSSTPTEPMAQKWVRSPDQVLYTQTVSHHLAPRMISLRWGFLWMIAALVLGCDTSDPARFIDAGRIDAAVPDAFSSEPCVPSPETCNGRDDDCDGLVDDADPELRQRLFSDPAHCGRCGNACGSPPHAAVDCQGGQCFIRSCEPGWYDSNGIAADGCETDCIISAGGLEQCDDVDNDCDGAVDETFDLQRDATHCGACGQSCNPIANGLAQCVESACVIDLCEAGWIDLDGRADNGCEYGCTPSSTALIREFCNGLDDDCDGDIDEAPELVSPEDFCGDEGACAPECDEDPDCDGQDVCAEGVCAPRADGPEGMSCDDDTDCARLHPGFACLSHATRDGEDIRVERRCVQRRRGPVCDGARGYRCLRGPLFQFGDERDRCDGADNDCDGRVDEDFAEALYVDGTLGGELRRCEAGVGVCRRTAVLACAPDGRGVTCPAVAAAPEDALDDDCSGVDDDCDGVVDEDFADAWVAVGDRWVYAYEASRPGATEEVPGLDLNPDDDVPSYQESRACSRPDALPWANVSWADAQAACAAAGATLCAGADWQRACAGLGEDPYPYGAAYDPDACNGGERDSDPEVRGVQDAVLPSGALDTCERESVYDLSGNLKEWTTDRVDGLVVVRGGGFETNVPAALRCDQMGDLKPDHFRSAGIGFRCCRPR